MRRLAISEIAFDLRVVTVSLEDGSEMPFYTSVWDDYGDRDGWRYATEEQARRGHELVVSNEVTKLMDLDTVLRRDRTRRATRI